MSLIRPIALIIDDEIPMRRLLRISLEPANYQVFEAATGESGLIEAATRKPDVILLDLGLPDMDGLAVLKRLREWATIPVVILSVRDQADEKVAALDAGADDYITKPFHADELLARLRVAQRHAASKSAPALLDLHGLLLDFSQRTVTYKGKPVDLTPTEYALLRLLAINAGKVLTQAYILRTVWGPRNEEHSQYLRVYISHLRTKLSALGLPNEMIKTETGIGYRLMSS